MEKRCSWGLCNSDSRYPDRLEGGIIFIPFPKPRRSLDKCLRWIKACGRPHHQLNTEIIDGNYHLFVCTKHFPEGKPTADFPDPIPADPRSKQRTSLRPPPKKRHMSEPTVRRRVIFSDPSLDSDKENCPEDHSVPCIPERLPELQPSQPVTPEVSPLDMLALAAENAKLRQDLAKQILENEELRRRNGDVEKKLKKQGNPPVNVTSFNVESIRDSPIRDNFKYYTGFCYVQFLNILLFLVPKSDECPLKFKRTVTSANNIAIKNQLLLTLVKLRLNFEFKHIANLMNISPQDAGGIFRNWINYMFYRFGDVPIWPERDILIANMPQKYKADFPDTFFIIDGTELKLERPNSLRSQSQCYSDYKSATTLKGLVGIDPRGSFTFISMLFSGSISDKEITTKSGLLQFLQQILDAGRLKKGDGIMVDKGFLIREEIESLGLKLSIPPFAPSSGQMTAGDVALTKKIARHRVHVELQGEEVQNC